MLQVDLSDLVPQELIALVSSAGLTESLLDDVAKVARAQWILIAGRELKTSAQTYIQGIQEIEAEPNERTITLAGWLANAIEQGIEGWDLRKTILTSPRARVNVDGQKYMAIPLRHGTPGTTGLAGTPMGQAYGPRGAMSRAVGDLLSANEAKKFGKEIYNRAKALRTKGFEYKSGKIKAVKAGRLKEREVERVWQGFGEGDPRLRPHHKSSIYAGMIRERKPYVNKQTGKVTVQSQYITFRTISEAEPEGWKHPGIQARNFTDKVVQHINRIIPATIAKTLRSAGL